MIGCAGSIPSCSATSAGGRTGTFNALALGAVQTEMLEEAFPDYKAPLTAYEMAVYAAEFTLNGHHYYNGYLYI